MNNDIFFFFYNLAHKSSEFDKIVVFAAEFLPYLVIILAGIFLLFHHEVLPSQNPLREFAKKWQEITIVFFSGISAWLLAYLFKLLLHTVRPFDFFPNVYPLFPEAGYAFPSGHATFFMALALAIFFSYKKAGYVFIFFALIIGLARIVSGVHFPADILAGFILGTLVAYFVKNV